MPPNRAREVGNGDKLIEEGYMFWEGCPIFIKGMIAGGILVDLILMAVCMLHSLLR